MSSEQLPSLVLGRRLAILVALHAGPRTLRELYADLTAQGYGDADALPGDVPGDPPPRWKFSFQADLEALRALGYDTGYDRKLGRYRWTDSPFGLTLTDAHLAALAHVHRTFAEHTFPYAGEIRGLITHLIRSLPPAQRQRLSNWPIEIIIEVADVGNYTSVDPATLKEIAAALKLQRQIEFDYRSPKHGRVIHHCVSPSPLILKNGHVYLYGYKDGATKLLPFRLDHIVPRTAHKAPISARTPIIHLHPIRYWLSPEIARGGVSPRFPQHQAASQPDGSAIVTAAVPDLWEAHKVLLTYAAGARALEPDELVTMMRDAANGIARHYVIDTG